MAVRWTSLGAGVLLLGLALGGPARGQDDGDGAADAGTTEEDSDRDGRVASRQTRGQQRLARTLLAKERALDRRERTLGQRQADLEAAEARLHEKIEALTAVRTDLQELLDEIEGLQDERLTKLQKMLSGMRDKAAAAVLAEMEPDLAVRVLDGMNRAAAAAALAKMDPRLAADLGARMTRPITLPAGR